MFAIVRWKWDTPPNIAMFKAFSAIAWPPYDEPQCPSNAPDKQAPRQSIPGRYNPPPFLNWLLQELPEFLLLFRPGCSERCRHTSVVRRTKPLENLRRALPIGDKNHRRLSAVLSKSAYRWFPCQTNAVSENYMENCSKVQGNAAITVSAFCGIYNRIRVPLYTLKKHKHYWRKYCIILHGGLQEANANFLNFFVEVWKKARKSGWKR